MKKHIAALISVLLCCLILATGCSDKSQSASQSQPSAMGRYVEEKVELPKDCAQVLYTDNLDDGTLNIYGYASGAEGAPVFSAWSLAKGGNDWKPLDLPWASLLDGIMINSFALDKDKNPWIVGGEQGASMPMGDPEVEANAPEEGTAPEDNSLPEDSSTSGATPEDDGNMMLMGDLPELFLACIKDGQLVKQAFNPGYADTFQVLENGDFLMTYYYSIALLDGKSGEKKYEIESKSRLVQGTYFVRDGLLYISNESNMETYDLATGEAKDKFPLLGDLTQGVSNVGWGGFIGKQHAISPSTDANTYYYANATGIYKLITSSDVNERIVDGSLTSMGMPSMDLWQLLPQADNTFLLMFLDHDGTPQLFRYSYDATVPTVPTNELNVYSLEDSPTIRQAITSFQQSHPDVRVNYEVGYTEGGGTTVEDAIKALATRLVANEAPDLILLDGLPYESYKSRGVLANLEGLLSADTKAQLIDNVTNALKDDKGLFALPARFTMPLVMGQPGSTANMETIPQLVSYIEKQESPLFGISTENFIRQLYPLYQERWFKDNQFQQDAFKEDLASLGRLAELYKGKEIPDFQMDMISASAFFGQNFFSLAPTLGRSIEDFTGPYSVKKDGGNLDLSPFQENGSPIFIPSTLLGVTEASTKKELAGEFINHVLSPETQSYTLGDGLPVNRVAMENNQKFTGELVDGKQTTMTLGIGFDNPFTDAEEGFTFFEAQWPDAEYLNMINSLIEGVKNPVLTDRAIENILADGTLDYLNGEKSIEDTMSALTQKLNLYLAENTR